MKIGVFGLGEAGSLIARDLAGHGFDVHAFDPADVETPPGVIRHGAPSPVAMEADLVIAVTAAGDAPEAMAQAWDHVNAGAIYADLATASPDLEIRLAEIAAEKGVLFGDVALMAPVPGRGLATPALASGSGARAYASIVNRAGGEVDVVGNEAGTASARKLLRSIVTKGLTALLIEALEASDARGDFDWMWEHLLAELSGIDEGFLGRLMSGTGKHAIRRAEEMRAAESMLKGMGLTPTMTTSTADLLDRIVSDGLPVVLERFGRERP